MIMKADADSTGVGSLRGGSSLIDHAAHTATVANSVTRMAPVCLMTHRALGPSRGMADHRANAAAITSPIGTATTKPALACEITTRGVARACSPRNAADATNDIDTR